MNSTRIAYYLFSKRIAVFIMAFLFIYSFNSAAQNIRDKSKDAAVFFKEKPSVSDQIKSNKIPAATLDAIRTQNELIIQQGRKLSVHSYSRQSSSSACGTCYNMGAENGWDVWQAEEGKNYDSLGLILTSAVPAPIRFNITTGPGIDPLTPGVKPGDPPITLVAPPGFGMSSIQLGQPMTDGQGGGCSLPINPFAAGCAERLTYCFTVGAADTNFIYSYAFVMENPGDSTHTIDNMPYVEFMILDPNGDTIPCAYQRYIASESFPGQYTCNRARTGGGGGGGGGGGFMRDTAIYKPWTIEGVNLSNYIGQTLTVVITNADCRLGGHFAHSYWDFACGSSSVILKPNCYTNAPDTLVAPSSPDLINSYSYEWFLNKDTIPFATTQTVTSYAQPGDTFTVKVSLPSGCNWSARYVPQHFSMTANYIYTTHCGYVDFTSQCISPTPQDPIKYWQWNFNGGSPATSNVSNPDSIIFPSGTHSVTLISGTYSPGCIDTIQYTFNVPQNPAASFTAPNVCTDYPLTITNTSTIGVGDTISSYSWNIAGGNPAASSAINPVVTFSNSGSSQITLIVNTANGCPDTVQQTINIFETPVASFSAQSFCFGEQLSLANTSTLSPSGGPLSYSWSFTGGNPSSSAMVTPAVSYANPGNSTIQLIASSTGGCKDTIDKVISIYPLPQADFNAPINCAGTPYSITNLSTAFPGDTLATYAWNFENAVPAASSQTHPVITFQTVDTSLVELITTTIHGCSDTIAKQVIVSANPHADFSLPDICAGSEIIFSNNSSVQPAGANITYSWIIPGGSMTSSTAANPVVTFSTPGSYTVNLIASANGGCVDTAAFTLNVFPLPLSSFVSPTLCKNSTVTLVNQSSVSNGARLDYHWSVPYGQPDSSQLENPIIRFDTTGTFPITLIAETQKGCRDTSNGTATVYKLPEIQINSPDTGCIPFCHTFIDLSTSADGSIVQWGWNFPGGSPSISFSQNPDEVCYNTPGYYDASITVVNDLGCSAYKYFDNIIKVYSNPVADFSISTDLAGNYPPTLTFLDQSSSNVVHWTWDFGDSSSIVHGGPVEKHFYSSASGNDFYKFYTTLIVTTEYGCKDTIVKPNEINPNFTFFVPNAFTPNGDSENNLFYAKGMGIKNYDFWIYDRWGLKIWSCHEEGSNVPYDTYGNEGMSSSCQWNGTINGNPVQQDVYVWRAKVTDVFGKTHVYLGSVTVFY